MGSIGSTGWADSSRTRSASALSDNGSPGWLIGTSGSSGNHRRARAVEEQPGDPQPDPDDEPEQAQDVDEREPSETLGPKPAEVGRQSDGEERHNEEQPAEEVALGGGGLERVL